MKKVLLKLMVLVSFVLVIGCCFGCARQSTEEKEKNAVGKLVDEGYTCSASGSSDCHWKGTFQKGNSHEKIYLATVTMNKEETEAFYKAYESGDGDAETIQNEIVYYAKDAVVEDITDQIPTQAELDSYIGKTFGDLEKEGYENTGYSGDEGVYHFYFDGPKYSLEVGLPEGTLIHDMDDYSQNDLRALKIGSVIFRGFNFSFDDEN